MSHNSNQYLKLCQELKHQGIEFEIEPGIRLARGYADLGFEEYYLLPNNKLVSIYLGTLSEYRDEQAGFFFVVPEIQDLVHKALDRGLDASKLKLTEESDWQYQTESSEDLATVLIKFLLSESKALGL